MTVTDQALADRPASLALVFLDRAAKSALQMLRFHLMGVEVAELTFGRRDPN